MVITLIPFSTFASGTLSLSEATVTIRSELSEHVIATEAWDNDGYIGIPVEFTTLRDTSVASNTCVAAYIVGHANKRVGTEADLPIVTDMLAQGYVVVLVDYLDNPLAISPNLDWSVQKIIGSTINSQKNLVGNQPFTKGNVYCIPAGYRIERGIYYFSLDKHAPNGTSEYIIDIYNTYYAGQVKDNNGEYLPTATTLEECIKKDGTPISMDLDLDLIYPSQPNAVVPTFMLASSSETRPSSGCNPTRPCFSAAVLNGYAGIIYDHEYIPMSRNDHFGYNDNAYTLYSYTANRSHSAAVRRTRLLAEEYDFDASAIAVWGFSKSSFGPAILSSTSHLEKGEARTFEKYCTEDMDPESSPQEQ